MPDPNLQRTAKLIQKILQQEDIGGIVLLSSKTHSEYLMELSPSWSCIRFNRQTGECRVKAIAKEFSSIEARNQCITYSCGLVLGLLNLVKLMAKNLQTIIMMMGKHIPEIWHTDTHEAGEDFRFES
jgi:hypothetical protein